MALPIGKVAIIVGAGVVGSVLVKEGSLPSVSDLFSGAFKIVLKGLKQDESTTSVKKPRNDFLMAQVDSLRQELQMLASSRPITIVTTTGASANRYGAVVIVIVVGYGYVWWKGWRLPDLMFATRRSLTEARENIAKQLENVYSSISAARRDLSARINCLDSNLDECAKLTASTKDTITDISAEVETINANVAFVRGAVQNLESKIGRIEEKQDITNFGVLKLVDFASTLGPSNTPEQIQASPSSSRAALEPPPATPISRIASLPPRGLSLELPSSTYSYGSSQMTNGDSVQTKAPKSPYSADGMSALGSNSNGNPSGYGFSLLTRMHSLSSTVLQQMRSSSQQS